MRRRIEARSERRMAFARSTFCVTAKVVGRSFRVIERDIYALVASEEWDTCFESAMCRPEVSVFRLRAKATETFGMGKGTGGS